jgi:hypothetical protein
MNEWRSRLESLLSVVKEMRSEFTNDEGVYAPIHDGDGDAWPNSSLYQRLVDAIAETENFLKSSRQS